MNFGIWKYIKLKHKVMTCLYGIVDLSIKCETLGEWAKYPLLNDSTLKVILRRQYDGFHKGHDFDIKYFKEGSGNELSLIYTLSNKMYYDGLDALDIKFVSQENYDMVKGLHNMAEVRLAKLQKDVAIIDINSPKVEVAQETEDDQEWKVTLDDLKKQVKEDIRNKDVDKGTEGK